MTQINQSVTYPKGTEETYNEVLETIGKIGKLRETQKEKLTLYGSTKYGLQTVYYGVSITPHETGSVVSFCGESDDTYGKGATNAFERLQEGILNINNPNYEYMKNGMSTGDIIMKVGFIPFIIICLLVWLLIPSKEVTTNITPATSTYSSYNTLPCDYCGKTIERNNDGSISFYSHAGNYGGCQQVTKTGFVDRSVALNRLCSMKCCMEYREQTRKEISTY